ncbi:MULTISPECIES: FHA domain-containing protein [unclassified Cryobacterium]|uniref:FHA domain-containing protein n=1 Tax=unclassified Cryobacterium TaxID=2649013 RepID=UPI001580D960|nr:MULTISPECIES: FHA domain-containing protein [unclassified Cryobacterium]
MSPSTRLDIDLAFSLVGPGAASSPEPGAAPAAGPAAPSEPAEQMNGTITARGLHVEVFSSKPELFVRARTTKLKDIRGLAADLAERGLTVSVSGPDGLIIRLGAVRAPVIQRLLTGSAHIALGSRAALVPLLRRRSAGAADAPSFPLPPPTLLPLVPTFDRRIRRRITTTHYAAGAGRPRLIFVVGSENWNGQMPREFDLLPGTTTIGSAPDADLQLQGLQPFHAEIRHDENDEYVLYPLGEVSGGVRRESPPDQAGAGQVLRTGARIEMGPWRMAFFREEYADHGRPYGGRLGGELSYQKPQPSRRSTPPQPPASAQPADAAPPAGAAPVDDSEI